MRRPQFLTMTGAAALRSAMPRAALAAARPPQAAWQKLNEQVRGSLIKVDFPLAHCKAAPQSAQCAQLFEDLRNPFFIGDHPGLTQALGWVDAWTTSPSV